VDEIAALERLPYKVRQRLDARAAHLDALAAGRPRLVPPSGRVRLRVALVLIAERVRRARSEGRPAVGAGSRSASVAGRPLNDSPPHALNQIA
jgi:hypothetical protein